MEKKFSTVHCREAKKKCVCIPCGIFERETKLRKREDYVISKNYG